MLKPVAHNLKTSQNVNSFHSTKEIILVFLFSVDAGKGSQVAQVVKNPPANAEDIRGKGLIPGLGRSSGGGHGNHSSILAWRIPWTEASGGLQSIRVAESRTQLKQLSMQHA